MFGLSLIEYTFHEFSKSDFTIDSLLTLSDLISKLTIVCVDYDDVEKLRTLCILLKSQWILCTMKIMSYKIDHCGNIKEIDLKHVDLFLLNEIKFIEYHLNELEKYFSCNANAKEIVCIYRRHIIFIKKPIEKGVYDIWNSYLQTFTNEMLSFKDILHDMSPSFLYQLSHCLNDWPLNTSTETPLDFVNNISFKKLRLAVGNKLRTRDGLEAIHQLICTSGVVGIIERCTALKETAALGVKVDLIQEIKRSFSSYNSLQWLYRETKSFWKCVLSEDHLQDNETLSSEEVSLDKIRHVNSVSKESKSPRLVTIAVSADVPRLEEDVTNDSKRSKDNLLSNDLKLREMIPRTKDSRGLFSYNEGTKRKKCKSDDFQVTISKRSDLKARNSESNTDGWDILGPSNSKKYISAATTYNAEEVPKVTKTKQIKDKYNGTKSTELFPVEVKESEVCQGRRTRSSDFFEKCSSSVTNNHLVPKLNTKIKKRRLLPTNAAPVDLDVSPDFIVYKINPKVVRSPILPVNANLQKNNSSKMCKERVLKILSSTKVLKEKSNSDKDLSHAEITIRSLVKKNQDVEGLEFIKDDGEVCNKDNVKAAVGRRHNWTIDETYLIYKGVEKNMIWSSIKSAYFRKSTRTNVHIKDRWRVVIKNKEFMKTLKTMYELDKD